MIKAHFNLFINSYIDFFYKLEVDHFICVIPKNNDSINYFM